MSNTRLSTWFGIGRATWLTIPRSMLVQMPDEWQEKLAVLLEQYDRQFPNQHKFEGEPYVLLRNNGKAIKAPEWLLNYRHPNSEDFDFMRHEHHNVTFDDIELTGSSKHTIDQYKKVGWTPGELLTEGYAKIKGA